MKAKNPSWRQVGAASGAFTLLGAALVLVTVGTRDSEAFDFKFWRSRQACDGQGCGRPGSFGGDVELTGEFGGTWYWMRSPEEEKLVVTGLYNRYCIRCHGVDGRGIWDIPGVPDFTNPRWQGSRSDGQLARATLAGRGAVMPSFRGAISLEEAWAMARYLRTFVPGTEASIPDYNQPEKIKSPSKEAKPKQ
jgi:hypothetical protein